MTTPGSRRRVLIVSPSDVRREGWTSVIADERTAVTTCPGPNDSCILLQAGLGGCPLVAQCDAAIYDFDATSPGFLATLLAAHRETEIVLVRDRKVRGKHRPSVVLRRHPRGTQFEAMV